MPPATFPPPPAFKPARPPVSIAKIFGGASTAQNEPIEVLRPDVAKGNVGGNSVARLLDVSVPARLEIVDNGVQHFTFRGGDLDFHPFLPQAMVGVPGIERFGSVAGDQQDSGHDSTPPGGLYAAPR